MTRIPAAVAAAIATRTGVNPTGVTRRAQAGACRRCHAPVLRGLDEDVAAFIATADALPLSELGELQAVLQGRSTYTLSGEPPSLDIRDQWRIKGRPAGVAVVLAEHRCAAPSLSTRQIEQRNSLAATTGRSANEPPPF